MIEILLVTVLLMTISGIALPLYAQAVDAARITRAIGDIRAMANEIMAFQILNGDLPDTLDEVGYSAHRDPYGNPYQYLNFGSGGGGGGGGGGMGAATRTSSWCRLTHGMTCTAWARTARACHL